MAYNEFERAVYDTFRTGPGKIVLEHLIQDIIWGPIETERDLDHAELAYHAGMRKIVMLFKDAIDRVEEGDLKEEQTTTG